MNMYYCNMQLLSGAFNNCVYGTFTMFNVLANVSFLIMRKEIGVHRGAKIAA